MQLKLYNFSKRSTFGLFGKTRWIDGFFRKKLAFFEKCWRWQICCRMRIKWYYFLKMSFPLQLWDFLSKNQKIFKFAKFRKYDEEREFLGKRTLWSFQKASLPKWKSKKYAGGSRLSCFLIRWKAANYMLWQEIDLTGAEKNQSIFSRNVCRKLLEVEVFRDCQKKF